MTANFKILAVLFLMIFVSCNSITHHKSSNNIKFNNGHLTLDSNAILANQNLELLVNDLENQDLLQKKLYQDIPVFIKTFLDTLDNTGKFLITNPGETWQVGCSQPDEIDYSTMQLSIDSKTGDTICSYSLKDTIFASRQLNYFGLGQGIALMKYYSGGVGKMEHILIFKFKENKVIDFWSGMGHLFKDNATKEEIIKYLKDNMTKYWGLNSNIIYL